jgi:hypothetical protein
MTKAVAKKIARKIGRSIDELSSRWNRSGGKYRADSNHLPRMYVCNDAIALVFSRLERLKCMSKKMRVVQVPRAGGQKLASWSNRHP